MDENIDLEDLDTIQDDAEKKLKVKNRFEKLSEKVILTAKERDELAAAKQALEGEKDTLAKERDFYKDFSTNISKYPNATEYQDKILEKVKSGYSTEDAMVAVLAKEGKLNVTSETPPPNIDVAGGSAPTVMQGNKAIQDMTPDEKLAALTEADGRGELINALRGR